MENKNNFHIVFMGSPRYALEILSSLYVHSAFKVVGIVTQPDKKAGRGKKLVSPPVKQFAVENKIANIQPRTLSNESSFSTIFGWKPDVIVVAAYGKILPKKYLHISKFGCINVHASLLPRWRGASPIQATILHGDQETGVTIMKMDEGIDTGPVICVEKISVEMKETAQTLTEKLSKLGSKLLPKCLLSYLTGDIEPTNQCAQEATYCGLIKKSDGLIDFGLGAIEIERKIRAYNPWPLAYFEWKRQRLKIYDVTKLSTNTLVPGERGRNLKYPIIGTATFDVRLDKVQMPGKNVISGKSFLNGARDW